MRQRERMGHCAHSALACSSSAGASANQRSGLDARHGKSRRVDATSMNVTAAEVTSVEVTAVVEFSDSTRIVWADNSVS